MLLNKKINILILFIVSILFSGYNFLNIKPMNPDSECCDHLFYRAQSVSWLNLDEKQFLQVPSNNRLNEVYENYYYKNENKLTNQPPYVYRVGIPYLAGIIGKVLNINDAYRYINLIFFTLLILGSLLLVFRITNNLFFTLISLLIFVALVDFVNFYFYDYMLVDVASIGVLTFFIYFVIEKKNIFLITLICIIGVLVKETLVLLGFTASLLIFKQAKKKIILIFITFLPILIQLLFRIFIKVPSPPSISEIYQFNDVSKPLIDLIASLGFLSVLLIGLILEKKYIILSLPTFLLITVINSSDLADGIRIWYTVIPLLFLGYGVIVKKCSIIQVNRVCSEHL